MDPVRKGTGTNTAAPEIVSTAGARARATVSVSGRLDRVGIAQLRVELAGCRAAGAIEMRLDLSKVTSWEPHLARTLAWVQSQLHANGGNLELTGADHRLRAQLGDAISALRALPGWR
jgi:hypothetical protein